MKKLIIIVLAACLLIGVPFMVMDFLAKSSGDFNIGSGYEKIKINLEDIERNNEVVFTKELTKATEVSFKIQSNSERECTIRITSDKKLIGSNSKGETYQISNLTGNSYLSSKMILQPGEYTIKLTNIQTTGELMIGYKEKEIEDSEFERLLKIDQGNLNNPPEGYELAYSTELSGLNSSDDTVYTLSLDHLQKVGLAVYTNATTGNVSVDFLGDNSSYFGLVTPNTHYICDKLENTFRRGDYKIQLTSNDADGEVYIFIKK